MSDKEIDTRHMKMAVEMFDAHAHRHGFQLGQDVVSNDPRDVAEPRGFIFAFRPKAERDQDLARVVFNNNAIRDVLLTQLRSAE